MSSSAPKTRIIVVGGGAGGLELVTSLARRYRRREDVGITLVDRNHSHIWKPLLHEVAAGTLNSNEDELSYLAQAHWNGFEFRLGALEAVDRDARTITVGPSFDAEGREYIPRRVFSYDVLVIAIGSVTNDFGIPGIAEHCLFLDAREQADAFHQFLVRACYAASSQKTALRPGQLHVAIAGAGATGVELAAELHHSIRTLVGFGLENIDPERDLRIHLIDGAERILPGLPEEISHSTREVLESIGVEVHTNEFITQATPEGFSTRSGRFIAAEIKIWAAGIKGAEVLGQLGLPVNRVNQLLVKRTLQSVADDDIFALGDCAACPLDASGESFVPPRAQAAHQQADCIARAIDLRLRGEGPPPEFIYRDFGSLINLSTKSTVGKLMGNLFGRRTGSIAIEGILARIAYLSLYKLHQVSTQGYLRTFLQTLANLLTRSSKPRLKLH